MSEKEAKIIPIKQSSILNSPLLDGDEVEIKEYTQGLADMAAQRQTNQTEQQITKEVQTQESLQQEQLQNKQENEWQGKSFSYSQPAPPPPDDDDVEEMKFSPDGLQETEHIDTSLSELEIRNKSEQDAEMLISLFNQFVPSVLGEAIKTDTAKIRYVMKYNEVPEPDIKEIETFLNKSNAEIVKELKLNTVQVAMLKPALARVLERHNLTPENPLINLAIVVASIAIQKIMAIKQILSEQTVHLQMIIKGYQLRLPKGYEDIGEPKKIFRIRRKRKDNLKEAA